MWERPCCGGERCGRAWIADCGAENGLYRRHHALPIQHAADSSRAQWVKTTVFLKSMNDFAAMNEAYGRHFSAEPPAGFTVEVARLPKDVLVEIEVIALAGE